MLTAFVAVVSPVAKVVHSKVAFQPAAVAPASEINLTVIAPVAWVEVNGPGIEVPESWNT